MLVVPLLLQSHSVVLILLFFVSFGGTSVVTVPFGGVDAPFLCRFFLHTPSFFLLLPFFLFRCDRDACCELLSCVCVVRQNEGVREIEE